MRVKCILCDKIEDLNDENPVAKRLRNRPIHTFMCNQCANRIAERTLERQATGNFRLYRDKTVDDEW
ncbi:YlaI family protein [Bacillus cytotoxicus]|uniref:YlaI family protein n=1 Tax=Bacillus cytotoxicus TaxID=580165 RepID=A0ACC6A7K4_9BACI|nr:YlaI family protein [Bacillus cytotoxicus]HDX9576622.1 YlaI family protein [Bacillus pseudomycoides]